MGADILVTGGAGFIGSHVVDELIKLSFNVIVLDDLSGGFIENINPNANFIKGSINDKELIGKIFRENKIEYIFHLAAYAAEGLSHFIRRFNYENNLLGSINLINMAINYKVKCFVFTSSIAVYGENQLPMKEELTPMPEDPYGIAKLSFELDLKAANKMFGLNYIIFRPHNVYGERQNIGDKYRNVVGIFMNKLMMNEPLIIFGDGKQTRAFTHIDDVAPLIANSVFNNRAYNQIFNIGSDKPYTVNELTSYVIKAMGCDENYNVINEMARNEVKDAFCSHEKIKEFLNYEPKIDLKEGLIRMAQWAKKRGSLKSKSFSNIEIKEKLPPSWKESLDF